MLSIRAPATEADIVALLRLDADTFGANAFPAALTRAILAADCTYSLCLFWHARMIGFGTLYPVAEASIEALRAGVLKETELRFLQPAEQQIQQSPAWYIPDLVIAPDFQKSDLHCGIRLFAAMLDAWHGRADLYFPATIYALAYSTAGLKFAQHNGFSAVAEATSTADGFMLVARAFNSTVDVLALVAALQARLQAS